MIGLLLALSALAIAIDPARAPLRAHRGSARRGPLAPGCAGKPCAERRFGPPWSGERWHLRSRVVAQAAALTQPLASGRPLAERFTYLYVLALLAALGSVLNARQPGGKAWAVLMALLVVVFLIPWLEDQTRLRRANSMLAASSRRTLVDLLWAARRRRRDELSAHALRPRPQRRLESLFILEYLALAPSPWLVSRAPVHLARGSAGRWLWS